MRLLYELRQYLDRTGLLTDEDRTRLDRVLPPPPAEPYDECGCFCKDDRVEEVPYAPWIESAERRSSGPSRRRPRVAGARTLRTAGLVLRLSERLRDWSPRLDGVRLVASRIAPCASWRDGSVVLAGADTARVRREALDLLRHGRSLPPLWDTLALDAHLDLVQAGESGPAVRAFTALVASPHYRELRKHHWLLREAAVADVCNLAGGRRALFAACRGAYQEEPATLWRALARARHPLAFWTLVLLHNAARTLDPTAAPRVHETGPLWRPPDRRTWEQAWAHALLFDSEPVARLLRLCKRTGPLPAVEALPDLSLMCPVDWHHGGR